jgi:hypothetical protein
MVKMSDSQRLGEFLKYPYYKEKLFQLWNDKVYVSNGEDVVQMVHTPYSLCKEIIGKLKEFVDFNGKRILVLNAEFIPEIDAGEVYFLADNKEKGRLIEVFYPGVKVIYGDLLNWENWSMRKNKGLDIDLFDEKKKGPRKFDVIVMNPPYQITDEGHGASAKPLYHMFIEKAIEMGPDYIVSVNPSRWMVGGKGLDDFRKKMAKSKNVRLIKHFPGDDEIFKEVSIKGGVNYFLWDKNYNGDCNFIVGETTTKRALDKYDVVVQDNNALPILEKVIQKSNNWIGQKCIGRKPFGLETNFGNWKESGVTCYSIGNKVNFVEPKIFTDKNKIIEKWKVVTSKGGSPNLDINKQKFVISNIFIIEPGAICTETYVVVNIFDTKKEAENFVLYMKTKFFRFMLGLRALTQDINKEKFNWIPDLEDYSRVWTDDDLYKKFELTEEEISYIESKIKILNGN